MIRVIINKQDSGGANVLLRFHNIGQLARKICMENYRRFVLE